MQAIWRRRSGRRSLALFLLVLPACWLASSNTASAEMPPEQLAVVLADAIRDALPREYEKQKDWGRTKAITSGLKVDGKLRSLSVRRRKKDVPHGLWKHYRASVVDDSLQVSVENLRSLGPGRAGCTLVLSAELDGWARLRKYNRGVHLGTITFEGTSTLRATLDCEVGFGLAPAAADSTFGTNAARRSWGLPVFALDPVVTKARLDIEAFRLEKVSKLDGRVAREIGRVLQRLIEDRLDEATLTAKLNRSIDKRREKLRIDPNELLGKATPASSPAAARP